jgi:ech hydrogenase subunit A
MDAGAILLMLIAIPAVGGLACLLFRNGKFMGIPVLITTFVTMVASVALLLTMYWDGVTEVEIGAENLDWMGWLITVLDFALMAYFLYTGVRLKNAFVIIFSLLQLVPLAVLESTILGEEVDPAFVIDYLAIVLTLVISIVGSIICIYAIKYMEHDNAQPRFFFMMLLFLGAMNGAVFANNLMWLFFFWEVTTLCSYLLIGHEKTAEAKESAIRAMVYTLGGGAALAFGLILINYYYETLSMKVLLEQGALGGVALLPVGLMALAAFTKSAQVPFQSWLLGAMVAPTPVSALLHSSTMVKLGVYLLLRISPVFSGVPELAWIVALVGAFSFLSTSILAVAQSNSKRVLAYSTIGNLGLIIMCVGINTSLAISAAIVLLLFHAISKALLFMCVGVVKHETGSIDIDAMAGLRDRMPFVSYAFAIGVFTIMLPPFGMFASKWLVSEATLNLPFLAFVLACGFAATIVYYSKWLGKMLAAGPRMERPSPISDPVSKVFKYTLGSLAVGAVAFSFMISLVVDHLVNPYVTLYFPSSVDSDNFSLFNSTIGEFPIVAMLVLVGILFLVAGLVYRPKQEDLSQAYMCGEDFKFETGGFYYISKVNEAKMTVLFNVTATILLAAMIAIPFMLEVL